MGRVYMSINIQSVPSSRKCFDGSVNDLSDNTVE